MGAIGQWFFRTAMKTHVMLYRRSGGRFGGKVRGQPILLLSTVGRKSGRTRTTPLMYVVENDEVFLAASAGGAAHHPAWYHNLVANPEVEVQIGADVQRMRARVTEGDERDATYQRFVDGLDQFGEYEDKADRQIPVVALAPITDR